MMINLNIKLINLCSKKKMDLNIILKVKIDKQLHLTLVYTQKSAPFFVKKHFCTRP